MRMYEFRVHGIGVFPFDMLRYDACWPHQERDARDIRDSVTNRLEMTISLVGIKPPTIDRWLSFGWQPENIKVHS